jgi:pyruvate kinase
VLTPNANDLEHMIETACQFASSEGFAEEGQRIIITVGVPLGSPGSTNMLRIAQVGKKKTPAV